MWWPGTESSCRQFFSGLCFCDSGYFASVKSRFLILHCFKSSYRYKNMKEEFRNFKSSDANVYLIEATEKILPMYSDRLSGKAEKYLIDFGVQVRTNEKVIKIEDHYLDTIKSNKSKPRIPFGSLIEMGILEPGMTLFDSKKKYNAKIMADGSIKCKNSEGSIHKVAAGIMRTESYNGWTYWHYNLNGAIVPIDHLRQRLISRNK